MYFRLYSQQSQPYPLNLKNQRILQNLVYYQIFDMKLVLIDMLSNAKLFKTTKSLNLSFEIQIIFENSVNNVSFS